MINNSWGTDGNPASPWVGTETECQLYDSNAYSSAQLNVFAASNDGPSAGTIGKHAAAKNVLTVGNVIDYDSTSAGVPGNIWSSSSRGPCGDGRWKPNVVAPGRWVTSADANNFTGYTEMAGTSMAAAHVTGVVADLVDAGAAFVYLPERISAHLMATSHTTANVTLTWSSDSHLDTYGAGRVDLTRALWDTGGTHTHWAFSLSSGGSTYADFTVPAGATRLVAVMHYVEPAASSGASQALINDWDFYLDQPPINPAGNVGEYSAQQSAVDNTEIRILQNPAAGSWRWKIWPDSTSTTAYFGVSIFVHTTDDTPAMSPTLAGSTDYAKPFETVQMDYHLGTTSGPISGVFLDASGTSVLTSSSTTLADGIVTDLRDNSSFGWDKVLGNVDPLFSRDAGWGMYWGTEGNKSFCVRTTSGNASNSGHLACESVIVDGTPPGLVGGLTSTSHVAGSWSSDPTVDMSWTAAPDPISGGTASGVDGYGHLVAGTATTPPQVKTLSVTTGYTTPNLATGTHYFNLRAVDRCGNWGAAASFGPLQVDTTPPSTVGGLASTTHGVGTLSCSTFLGVSWAPSADGHSGTAGYGVSFSTSPLTAAPTVPTQVGTSATTTAPGASTLYAHVRSIDNVGNASPTVHLGPFPIDPNPVTTFCTAKVNSQGCTPTITTSGLPSFGGGGIQVNAVNVLNNKSGLLFWGITASATPFQGGTKCVANPVQRTSIQNSGGNPPPDDCSGGYTFHFTTSYMASKGIAPGDTIHAQYWSRDPFASFTTGLTDAVTFSVCQ